MKIRSSFVLFVSTLLAFFVLNSSLLKAHAQGTAFAYQGQLQNNGSPASGTYNLQFTLYTNATTGTSVAGPVTTNGVVISNGLFTVTIDFGSAVWNGATNWLQIGVETNKATSFTSLMPRQRILPAPYAIFAEGANATGLTGTVQNGQLAYNSITVNAGTGLSGGGTVALGGSTTLNNAGVTALTAGDGVTVSASSGPITLGLGSTLTLGSLPVSIITGGTPVLYADNNENFFAGYQAGNVDMSGFQNIAVGQIALLNNTSGYQNTAVGYGALFGNTNGIDNTANGYAALFANTSGSHNTAVGINSLTFNTSGSGNTAVGDSALFGNSTGSDNTANGYDTLVDDLGSFNTAGGALALENNNSGSENTADGYEAMQNNTSGYANTGSGFGVLYFNANGTVNSAFGYLALQGNRSGSFNVAIGAQALINCQSGAENIAIGYNAGSALDGGEFSDIDIGNSGVAGESDIIRIGDGQSATYLSGKVYGTSFNSTSDRNAKEHFTSIDASAVLAKVAALPVTEWNYKDDKSAQHIGPVAQDFHTAFGLNGGDDKHISVVDEGGVALAAIQGLNQKLEEGNRQQEAKIQAQGAQIQSQSAQIHQLQQSITQLKALMAQLAQNEGKPQ